METSLIVKLQVSMCYEHTFFTIKDSLTLVKFWLSLLWQSEDELTWAFGDIDEELFSDACDQFDIKQILPLAAPGRLCPKDSEHRLSCPQGGHTEAEHRHP